MNPKARDGGKPVALLTGAAGSLGRELGVVLAVGGYDLVLHGRTLDGRLRAVEQAVRRAGARATSLACDLTRDAHLRRLVERAVRWGGRLDLLVNSASAFEPTRGDGTPAHWEKTYRVNAVAPFLLARAAAPYLARSGGSVVNLLDVYAEHPLLKDHAAYLASKGALLTLTRLSSVELAPRVRVNAVAPGAITFPPAYPAARREALKKKALLRRSGSGREVAEAVLYLAGAGFVTGQILRVDGGRFV